MFKEKTLGILTVISILCIFTFFLFRLNKNQHNYTYILSVEGNNIKNVVNILNRRLDYFGQSSFSIESKDKNTLIISLHQSNNFINYENLLTAPGLFIIQTSKDKPALEKLYINNSTIDNINIFFEEPNQFPVLRIKFNQSGSEKLEKITEQSKGKKLLISLDKIVISSPIVHEKIASGDMKLDIGKKQNREETLLMLKEILSIVKAGPLEANIKIIESSWLEKKT